MCICMHATSLCGVCLHMCVYMCCFSWASVLIDLSVFVCVCVFVCACAYTILPCVCLCGMGAGAEFVSKEQKRQLNASRDRVGAASAVPSLALGFSPCWVANLCWILFLQALGLMLLRCRAYWRAQDLLDLYRICRAQAADRF